VYRLYREAGLAVRRRKRKRVAVPRAPQPAPTRLNERWAMDFMSDVLVGGRRYRIFNVLERLSREALASEVDTSLPAVRVIRVLDEIALECGYPVGIVVDTGTEFRSTALDAWAYEHGVTLEFIRPGKPTDSAFIESFNAQVRRECLSQHYFSSLIDARVVLDAWQDEYNNRRPHGSLGQRTPAEYRAEVEGIEAPEQLALSVPGCSSVG